jgi:SnoaL-like domain
VDLEPSELTLDDLLVREEIGDVIKLLARGTDRLDEELIASCYHPDGTDDHNVFRGSGVEFARWVVETLPHFEATMHFTGSPHVRIEGDVAHVDTYCVAHHISRPDELGSQSDMVLGLRYVDRFERRSDRWLVAARVCAFDWTYTVPFDAAVAFKFEEGWTIGARDRSDITYGAP